MQARQRIERFEARPALPDGSGERFNGYGIMGLPFRSGHVLAQRGILAIGHAYFDSFDTERHSPNVTRPRA